MTMKMPMLMIGLLLSLASTARAQHPLFIINGVRIPQCGTATGGDLLRLSDIDPNVIESIEVVKGPAAARQYGPDAANGVITISTKKGSVVSPMACGTAVGGNGATTNPVLDPVATYLYTPEFVMAHQEAIVVTDRQRTAIQDAVRAIQSKAVVDAQLQLASAGEKLSRALARPSVDETVVLQQLDDMLALERDVKRAQMTLLVRIKNLLTPTQQALLDKSR
jgi:TonB-dependent SusC/RagA subfamily outer membrane receptor